MNNNFYEIPTDWYNEFNNTFMNPMNNNMVNPNNMPNMMPNQNNNLADPKTAFLRGNLYNNLYDPYKNYKYRELKANNNREELLYNILAYNFALTDLNLYLDVYPNDANALNLYNRYLGEKKRLCDTYEQSFGPLTAEGLNIGTNNWNWDNSPWPWEVMK